MADQNFKYEKMCQVGNKLSFISNVIILDEL